ncbi:MAG: ferrochelatase [Pseudomonadota bacterium]|nr:ferrochelatase [Pseudomonadota bacterium]
MSPLSTAPAFEHGRKPRIGVLLCNVGTPEAPTTSAVRRYLAEFLSDPRIVDLPRLVWLPVLHGVILNTRPQRSAAAYATIWESEGSPLLTASQRLCAALEQRFKSDLGDGVAFALGMRYGNPSIAAGLEQLIAADARRILIVPLYPQYASATTGSVYDAVLAYCRGLRWVPELRFINDYHADTRYIGAVAESISEFWSTHGRRERLLMSFHGIPRDTFLAGDPYYCQCQATGRLLAEHLEFDSAAWSLSFQSRIGPKTWLEPYTDVTLVDWARGGLANVDVVCPGFSVDCLETLEEIAMRYAALFEQAGGQKLRYIPALNDRAKHVSALAGIISGHLSGWLDEMTQTSGGEEADRRAAAERARTAGATR